MNMVGQGSGLKCSFEFESVVGSEDIVLENRWLHEWPWLGLSPIPSQRNQEFCPDSALESWFTSFFLQFIFVSMKICTQKNIRFVTHLSFTSIIHKNISISILFFIYGGKRSASLKGTFHHWVAGGVSAGASDIVCCCFVSIGRKNGFWKGEKCRLVCRWREGTVGARPRASQRLGTREQFY